MALVGANYEEKIWNYLKTQGFSDTGAAGLMGNLYAESGLYPNNLQDSYEKLLGMSDAEYTKRVDQGTYSNFVHDGAGYGLAQWTYWTRKHGLLEYAIEKGVSIGDLEMQLEYLCKELKGYPELLSLLKSNNMLRTISNAFMTQFERPADQSDAAKDKRARYGFTYYNKYANKPAAVSSSASAVKDEGTLNVVQSILTKNPCYTNGKKITVKGLMLHSVGCAQPSASVFIKTWNSASYLSACVHGFIDANDGTVYQTLPWNHRGWHCGGSGNGTHIGVEMCEPGCIKYTSGATFICSDLPAAKAAVKRTYESAVKLFAKLCKEYGLNPLGDGVIVSHKEGCKRGIASNHGDPEHLWDQLNTGYTMDGFRKDVAAIVNSKPAVSTASEGEQAVDKLAKIGVINSPDYWKKNLGAVKYLDELFIKAAAKITGAGTRMSNPQMAIEQLVKDGIINSPDYWKLHVADIQNLDALMCALGGARKD